MFPPHISRMSAEHLQYTSCDLRDYEAADDDLDIAGADLGIAEDAVNTAAALAKKPKAMYFHARCLHERTCKKITDSGPSDTAGLAAELKRQSWRGANVS